MTNWFSPRTIPVVGMILVSALFLAVRNSGPALLVTWLPWLVLLGGLSLLVSERRSTRTETADHDLPIAEADPEEPRRVEAVLSDRLVFERTTAAILEDFVRCGLEEFEENMSRVLSRLGSYTGANRCYLYRYVGRDQECVRLMTWLAPTDSKPNEPPLVLPAVEAAQLNRIFEEQPVVLINRIDESGHALEKLPPWSQTLQPGHSCGAVRILQDNKNLGFLGFDAPAGSDWGASETSLLHLIANLFSTMFFRLDAQQRQVEAMNALKASSKAKSEFLANMSHEIRTPLNGVIGIADLLKEMNLTAPQQEYVEIISKSGSLLMSLVNDVLDMSKIEAGQLILDTEKTHLRTLVEDLVCLIAFNAQTRGLEMIYRLSPELPEYIVVDPDRLRQILTNLLNNATKFTQKGHVYLNIEPEAQDGDLLVLRLQVTDTGIGITQGQANRIFEKFTQADPTTTRRFGGTGLGLSICRHLVDLMGGRIWANGALGGGSTFSFTLPVESVPQDTPAAQLENPRHVLLLTGHELARATLAEQIRGLGHNCLVASNVEKARAALDRTDEPWSHVIVDPQTLPTDADQILAKIQDPTLGQHPEVVLLCPLSTTPHSRRQPDGRVIGVLTKPVRSAALASLLEAGPQATTVPDDPVTVTPEMPVVTPSDEPADGLHVLLAEDNLFNQKVACGMLKLLGCQVTLAANGSQALETARINEFDLIFMDCQMPEMDGYEATRRIRELPGANANIPIIAITANAFRGDREACLASGMDDYLTKPVGKAQFDQMLAKWSPLVTVGG